MSIELGKFIVNYLLFPVIVLILGLVAVIIAKKNQLLSNKKAVVTVLLSSLTYSLFGFSGFFGMDFMPYVYLFIQIMFLLLGFANQKLLKHFIPELESYKQLVVIMLQLVMSWALFAIIFNFSNEFQYGFWAGTSLLPILFYPVFELTFRSYLKIPAEIYKIKVYHENDVFEPPHGELDVTQVMVIGINVPKFVGDENETIIKSKAVKSFVLGEWFGMIMNDYNKQHLDNQVELCDSSESYGWIFYTEKSFMKSRRYIDSDKTFEENGLETNSMIIARRVKNVK
ncbi:MAG: hypothetical protein KBT22_05830 [Bacteroidales bacterium]|nr:hypothetical protein [Candidatus Scybalocola fimicaballi]